MLDELLEEFANNLRGGLAKAELERIRGAGMGAVRFCWAGGEKRGEGHYYRLVGPTFVIEYDNTQDHANHVHTVWHARDPAGGDFGLDLLRRHYTQSHAPPSPDGKN